MTGRLVTRIDGHDQPWAHRYDPDGLLVERTSPTGLVESITYDDAGRVVRHRVPGRTTTGYTYDPAGQITTITDRHGRRRVDRDAAGRVVAETDPLGRTTRYTYDPAGRPREQLDPTGARRLISYDRSGRARRLTATGTGPDVTITVDRDRLGRPVRIHDTGATPIDLKWDADGRLTERRTGAHAIGWTYDPDGLRTRPGTVDPG